MKALLNRAYGMNAEALTLVFLMAFVAGFVLLALLSESAAIRARAVLEKWWGE